MIYYKSIFKVMGGLLLLLALSMLPCIAFSLYYRSGDHFPFISAAIIAGTVGATLFYSFAVQDQNIRKREGYLIVALSWVFMTMFGLLPYLFSGSLRSFADALFETVSGFTTTGASVVVDIEALPKGILLWRSMTQWLGGLGIIVLTVAIFPLLGIGGIELFAAESTGPAPDKLHPRIQETAKRLWVIYFGLTVLLVGIYYLQGMSFFDSACHSLSTMSTGGFSTKNSSIAFFDSATIEYTTVFFMFLSGTNFSLIYLGLQGKLNRVWANEEFRAYFISIVGVVIILALSVYAITGLPWERAFRDVLFQVVSLVTTTGYVTADYTSYGFGLTIIFFMFLFTGACAGSTSGGIKFVRHLTFVKNSTLEFKRIVHPRAVIPLKINGERVRGRVITHIFTFLLVYLMIFVSGSIVMSVSGYDLITSFGAVATSLGNVGPAIGLVGPMDNFAFLSPFAKLFLSFLMLLGRLELFTILVLFTPYFWRAN